MSKSSNVRNEHPYNKANIKMYLFTFTEVGETGAGCNKCKPNYENLWKYGRQHTAVMCNCMFPF